MNYLRYGFFGLFVYIGVLALVYLGPLVILAAVPVVLVISIGAVCSFLWNKMKGRSPRTAGSPDRNSPSDNPNEMYENLRDGVVDAAEFIRRRLSSVWSDVEEDLARLSLLIQKRSKILRWHWMRKRVEEMVETQSSTFDFLSQKMNDPGLNVLRVEYTDCCSEINEIEKEIGDIRNAIAMTGEKFGGPNHRILKQAEESLKRAEAARRKKIESSRELLVAYGVDLNSSQVEVLLSRVDAGEIVRMTTVFSVISKMTQQLARAKGETGENLDVTKKYYGMYIALLELQMYIQNEYLDRLNNEYIPGVESISNEASDLYKLTQQKHKQADGRLKEIYEKNLKSQKLGLPQSVWVV